MRKYHDRVAKKWHALMFDSVYGCSWAITKAILKIWDEARYNFKPLKFLFEDDGEGV